MPRLLIPTAIDGFLQLFHIPVLPSSMPSSQFRWRSGVSASSPRSFQSDEIDMCRVVMTFRFLFPS